MGLPPLHRRFVDELIPRIRTDSRIVGVAAGGSLANGTPDEYSDVDLVLAVEDADFDEVMAQRQALIASWAPVVAGFTGEHVGEPRLIITLVGPPLLHVDVKFVRIADAGARVDDLRVLWERDGRLTAALAAAPPAPPQLDLQWIEDRFWVWVHYGATKLARGELFEVVDFLAYLRATVFGPLIQHRHGRLIQGVRRVESLDPAAAAELRSTLCGDDPAEVAAALYACVDLYRRWSEASGLPVVRNRTAEALAVEFLHDVGKSPAAAR
jgi:hypothetical protein